MFEYIADKIIYSIFFLEKGSQIADVVHFFVYDSLKILVLLLIMTHLMSLLRFYIPLKKIRKFLVSHKLYGLDYLVASLFGALTPFCSCSSIPLFMGFVGAGVPLGVTFAFLITSPLINEIALALFLGLFGIKITLIYLGSGILIGVLGGWIISKLKLEKYIDQKVFETKTSNEVSKKIKSNFKQIIKIINQEALKIMKSIVVYVLLGIGIGALIHGYVPSGYFEAYISKGNLFAVPLAVILAVPLYSNASGVIPIVEALIAKGIPIGTALAFMMATVGLSLPEALILKRIMKLKLLLIFFAIVALAIIILGYLFNIII
jgi:uncharacterized membrane protein YraQ (UPF0718 family)